MSMNNKVVKPVSRQQRRRQERRKEVARAQPSLTISRRWLLIGGPVAAAVIIAVIAFFTLGNQQSASGAPQPGGTVDGISCSAEMLQYHIHDHMTLYNNGQPVPLPANIGIPYNAQINVGGQNYCLYWLHTHAADGIVHIESPIQKDFTLSQFFDVWHYTSVWDAQGSVGAAVGAAVDRSFVDTLVAAKPDQVHVYVNGKLVSNYRNILLTAHELITVELGEPLVKPETSYNFKGI